MAIFASSVAVAGAFGGLLATGISFLNGSAGLEGWRWYVLTSIMLHYDFVDLLMYCLCQAVHFGRHSSRPGGRHGVVLAPRL